MQFDATWTRGPDLPLEMKIRYSQQVLALHVPADIAAIPLATADARLYANACRSCEEELAALDGSLSARIRALLPDEHQAWPSLKNFADRFSMSARTLIRKLEAEGCNYQSILDEAKSEMATWYLCNTGLPISVIAERLGFMDDSNFSRSFRRWRGMKPLEYRKAQQIASDD
jgi:AraC-like DNA-binding protein